MLQSMRWTLPALMFVLLLGAGCGDGAGDEAGGKAREASLRGKRPAYALEIWVPYPHPAHEARKSWLRQVRSLRMDRTKAQELALALHAEVVKHPERLPILARTESGAVGGWIGGYSGPIGDPTARTRDDARTAAILRAELHEITEVVEWNEGFWFGQRISSAEAKAFDKRLVAARSGVRVRALVINKHHSAAKPRRHDYDKITPARARQEAEVILAKALERGSLKGMGSHADDQDLEARDGLFFDKAKDGTLVDWVGWDSPWTPYRLLVALLDDAPVGEVYPKVVETEMGFMVLQVLERRAQPRR